ncbi:MAG: (cytosine-5-)-methyltransferase, partial [Myxococcaceae bacterium]|nr:(cytosine-5-)-methyltransferase [Myxococcaceae bacterium]
WPNRSKKFFPGVNALELLHDVLEQLVGKVSHVVVQVGCTTDPRFLKAVPDHWPFWRTCSLRYSVPSFQGSTLMGGDVAYVFGPERRPHSARVAPGECTANGHRGRGVGEHPCPRALDHLRWLVRWFSLPTETVLDPFCGRGTALIAAKEHARSAIGWDIEPAYCELARRALRQREFYELEAAQ